jgi:3-oxoacyl-(acyl-carrier-protein) synthase
MNLRIAGMGWVTPLGRGVGAIWEQLLRGNEAIAQTLSNGSEQKKYPAFLVPHAALKDLPPHPRLRRASAISRFAAAAGLDALADAGVQISAENAKRIALVFAVSNGGVVYTKRFYHDIVQSGARSASPLMFPETVFNAPASHLAAILGVTGASYTLVGDGAVGILAIKMAEDLMTDAALEYCLVVGAEEADWLLCDAYKKWRLLKAQPPIEPFRQPPRGMIPSEGAGAILFAREGAVMVDGIDSGTNFANRREAGKSLATILSHLAGRKTELVIAGANGTFVDLAEWAALQRLLPHVAVYSPKPALGESIGASAVWQVIVAAQSLRTQRLPPFLHLDPEATGPLINGSATHISAEAAIVLSCGLSQQAAGLTLSVTGRESRFRGIDAP